MHPLAIQGYPDGDSLACLFRRMNPRTAHRLACQGGAVPTWARLFEDVQRREMRGRSGPGSTWQIISMFSGAETFLVGLRAIGQRYNLAYSCDSDAECRRHRHRSLRRWPPPRHRQAVHPGALITIDASAPPPLPLGDRDVALVGWPCQPFTNNNIFLDVSTMVACIAILECALVHVVACRPRVIILENVPGILDTPSAEAIARVDAALMAYKTTYKFRLDILCPSTDGSWSTRARAIWRGRRLGEPASRILPEPRP